MYIGSLFQRIVLVYLADLIPYYVVCRGLLNSRPSGPGPLG